MKKTIKIEGMSCGHCVTHVKNALEELEGVKKVEVDLALQKAFIESEVEILDKDIKFAIEDAGYEVIAIEG